MEEEKKPGQVCAEEVAESELERFLDAQDLVVDRDDLQGEDLESFNRIKKRFVRAMKDGHLVVDEKGQPVYTPLTDSDGPITFVEWDGKMLTTIDSIKNGKDVQKSFTLMAAMTHQTKARLLALKGRDLKTMQAIMSLFLAD